MGVAARELEREVVTILYDAGAKILDKGFDGSGHQTVTFSYRDTKLTYHYPHTGRMNGHSKLNVLARLKRILRETPIPTFSPEPVVSLPLPVIALPPTVPSPATSTLPVPDRLSRERRKEIGKMYVSLRSIEAVCQKTGRSEECIVNLLQSQGGEPQRLVKIELNTRKAAAARLHRERLQIPDKVVSVSEKDRYDLPLPIPTKRGRGANNLRRDVQIARLVYQRNVPPAVVGSLYGIQASSVIRVARNAAPVIFRSGKS